MPELNEYWSAKAFAEYEGYLHEKSMRDYSLACELQAPHVVHNANVSKDGDMYCCLLGDNLQVGIAGFGKTPKEACAEFDRIWAFGEKEE